MKRIWLWLLFALPAFAAEQMPPVPDHYFNDYAHVVSPGVASELNSELDQFERQTSNQLVVAIYPKMTSDSSLEDFTQRLIDAWHPGQKGKDNGAVLFAFIADHRLRIATNYGLEGALPDVVCKRIIDEVIAPRLRAGDYDGAFTDGVAAMIAATKGEYQGNGQTVYGRNQRRVQPSGFAFLFIIILVLISIARSRRHVVYGGGGRGGFWGGGGPWIFPGGGWGGGGGGGFGGFGGGGGGGGFMGGGGMGGGGGASGSW